MIYCSFCRQAETHILTSEESGVPCGHAVAVCTNSNHSAHGTSEYAGAADRNKSTSSEHKSKSATVGSLFCLTHIVCHLLLLLHLPWVGVCVC